MGIVIHFIILYTLYKKEQTKKLYMVLITFKTE